MTNTRQIFIEFLDDRINQWNDNPELSMSLREFLGMTSHEYGLFLVDAENIFKIMMEQQNERTNT